METKAFRIIGMSRDEAESLGLSLSHRRQVGGLSVFYRLLSGLASPPPCSICDMSPLYFRRALKVRQQPPSGKTTKIMNHCSPSLFHSYFIPLFSCVCNKLPHSLQSLSSLQLLKTAVPNHLLSSPSTTSMFSFPTNPPQTHLLQIPCFSS